MDSREQLIRNTIRNRYKNLHIEPCFGFMLIKNPLEVEFVDQSSYEKEIEHLAKEASKCNECCLFTKCAAISEINALRGKFV